MNNPGAFWLPSETYPTSQLPPVAQIANCYLQAQRADVQSHIAKRPSCVALVEYCDAHESLDFDTAARALFSSIAYQNIA